MSTSVSEGAWHKNYNLFLQFQDFCKNKFRVIFNVNEHTQATYL